MNNIIVISQNVKLESLSKLKENIIPNSETLIVSTQLIFENEAELIDKILECKCKYINFSDLISDAEEEKCDYDAFNPSKQGQDVFAYYEDIKILKNQRIVSYISQQYSAIRKFIVCDDLGIHLPTWIEAGYNKIECEYYHNPNVRQETPQKKGLKEFLLKIKRKTYNRIRAYIKNMFPQFIYVAYDNKQKYVFVGTLNRIGYRMNLDFKSANIVERFRYWLDCKGYNTQPKTIRLSTLHGGYHTIPDRKDLNVKLLQDGYLPPNYTSRYLYFFGLNTEFYTWDVLGNMTFEYHHLPHRIIPFRKKLYLPQPIFPIKVKKVLCVASGAGDWTAIKNRSDEDKMIQVFGKVAKQFPDIQFVYRCHPVWIHPLHQGVNSINRVADYISWLNLPNLSISSNIPTDGDRCIAFKRSSFEEDLKDVDIVFGEHSIGMIDAAFKNILFASVNVTGHRNFWCGISDLGFPHCESEKEIANLLTHIADKTFVDSYSNAIYNYNKMTDIE